MNPQYPVAGQTLVPLDSRAIQPCWWEGRKCKSVPYSQALGDTTHRLKRLQPLGKRERGHFSGRGESSGPSMSTGLQPSYLRLITRPQPNKNKHNKTRWQRKAAAQGQCQRRQEPSHWDTGWRMGVQVWNVSQCSWLG